MSTKLSRRDFLRLSALAAAGAAVAACTPKPTATPEPTAKVEETKAAATEEAGPSAKQSPIFQDMVKAGDLPPLEERMPADPLVVKPYEKVGIYGSTWRSGSTGKSDGAWQSRTMAWEDLLRWKPDLTEIIPNVASAWDVTDDGKEWLFYLRKGMKWSDGHPFTADDFVWWYENHILNDELSPSKPSWMKPGGELGTVEKVDDTTVKFTFSAANGLFLFRLANSQPFLPGHYLEQFHIAFNKDEVEKGNFRENLYYRLNVLTINVPPLRSRGQDILLIADHFLKEFAAEYECPVHGFTPEAKELMMRYQWPGNVRELRHALERITLLSDNEQITIEELEQTLESETPILLSEKEHTKQFRIDIPPHGITLAEAEKEVIQEILDRFNWNKRRTSKILGISRPRLDRKIQLYRLTPQTQKTK